MNTSEADRIRDTFDKIVGCLQQGQAARAESLAGEALQDHPQEPNILRLSGIALIRQGKFQEAAKHLAASVKISPEVASGHEQYGLVLAVLNRLDEAEKSLRTALTLDPDSQGALSKLSRLQAMQGKAEESKNTQERMMQLSPEWQKMREAMKLQADDKHDEARRLVKKVLRESPDNVNALNVMGGICLAQEAFNDAEAFLRQAVALAPDFAVAWSVLSISLKEQGKFEEAVEALEKALSLEPRNVDWHSNLGNLLLAWGKEERALASFERALALKPDHASALLSKGHVLKTMGDLDSAIGAYRASAKVRPDLGEIYWSLANLKTFRFKPDEVEFMRAQLESGKLTDDSRLNFCYSLGKHFEDRKDYATAFEYYTQGGAIKRKLVKFDPVEFGAQADKIIEVFTPAFFEERATFGYSDPAPIFIVGLPRSGSTLIEQILCSHSQVDGTAELADLMTLAHQTTLNRFDNRRFPESLLDINADNIEHLGKQYIERTSHHRQGAPCFTDKMPNNFPYIGFLHLLLPNAKVIDARRHPLDSCFGTFKQLFAKGQPFSYDLFDLGLYYKSYIRLMEHWDRVLPGKVLRVQYEDNVADIETQARRMIDHCGLEWEGQVLRFYETERAVKTASSEQVRQPIYSQSVNSWKRYETELAELILVLEEVLEKLPEHLERPKIPA
ncbi:MAG: sulfotransferase [Gammaproteobacteria bacterium]|nr:sulfotransferase [Gammaproteobacteria bacterium]